MNLMTVEGDNGRQHELYPKELWYCSPNRTEWNGEQNLRPIDFAFVLHNAKVNHGLVPSMADLLSGIEIKSFKSGSAKKAEEVLEEYRVKNFPKKPSRLRCFYLNPSKPVAKERMKKWKWDDKRDIVLCYIILSSGEFHFADITIYEQLALQENIDGSLVAKYWQDYTPAYGKDQKLEILADSMLYFPDWRNYKELNQQSLMEYLTAKH